jgi:hypothetical protein
MSNTLAAHQELSSDVDESNEESNAFISLAAQLAFEVLKYLKHEQYHYENNMLWIGLFLEEAC